MAARAKRVRRAPAAAATRATSAPAPAAAANRSSATTVPPTGKLLLAAAAVLALVAWMRFTAPLPWSYDEYYHLGLAREMRSDLRLESFWWTPFSTLYDRFVDSTPLFHLLLMPLAPLPLELASSLGVVLGQLFVVGSFAWAFASLRVPRAWWFLLAVPAMGTMLLQRLEMLRPHVWLIGFSVLVIALLAQRRWKTLLAACAVFGLTHTGGWIAIPMAVLWSLSGLVVRDPEDDPASRSGPWRARVPWQPVAAAAGGWLLGQLVHPQVPNNFRLFFIANFVVPFQAGTASGDASLKTMLGSELFPPEAWILRGQWPAYVVAALVVFLLVRHPSLRTRATLTAALPALAFLFVGSVRIRRFLELGEPLVLLALALIAREAVRRGLPPPRPGQRKALAAVTGLALVWTVGVVRMAGDGRVSAPLGMARWLGEHGRRGERVFTAQWADSSPLFYAAPQLQSLVALDPTVFYTKDRQAFERYVTIALGRDPAPAKSIRDTFGARWVTLWRQPVFEPLARQLWQKPGITIVYQDPDYWVIDLGGGPP